MAVLRLQLLVQRGHRVTVGVDRVGHREQPLLLGEQEEHQAHQRGQRTTVDVPFGHRTQQRTTRLAVQPGQLGDEQLDRLAYLVAQGRRDVPVSGW